VSKLLNKVEFSDHLPLFSDVTDHPTLRFPSRQRVNPAADNCFSVKWVSWRLAAVYGDKLLTGRWSHSPTSQFPMGGP